MIEPAELIEAFARNTRIIELQTDGLAHADSLIQTGYNINCLNWVVGHMAHYRDEILAFLGQDRLMGPPAARYARESDPILEDGPGVVALEELVAAVRRSQDRIAEVVGAMEPDEFAVERGSGERAATVGARLLFYYFHDTYHAGQTELLRQFTGVADSII